MLRLGAVVVGLVGMVGLAAGQNPPAVPPAPPAGPQGDLGLMQGHWKPLSVEYEGKAQMTAEEMKKVSVVFDQNEYHLYFVDRKPMAEPKVLRLALMNVAVDTSTSPKTITFEFAEGMLKGQKRHGIYELAGNQLKMCYGPVEKPKPTKFEAPANSGLFLEVWAKQPSK